VGEVEWSRAFNLHVQTVISVNIGPKITMFVATGRSFRL